MYSLSELPDRFVRKISVQPDGCWLWTGATNKSRKLTYGNVGWKGNMRRAHRVVYEILVSEIPQGLQLDHLCSVPLCVNPEHMEPVTAVENIQRSQVKRIKCHCGKCKTCYNREYSRRRRGK